MAFLGNPARSAVVLACGVRLFLLGFLLIAACGKKEPDHPNVLVVTIDTLRPDAIGPGTPALNAFLAEARRFGGARTVVPLTLPAHTSLFTGLFPSRHGMHDNVNEPLPPRDRRGFPLLAEQFKDKGYATAGFVARAVLAGQTGIGAGFDVYDCPASDEQWEEEGGYIPGDERVRAPIAWIEGAAKGKPWFVWVHLFDPHAPYHSFLGDDRRPSTRDTDPPQVRYAGEVRRADAAFEKLIAAAGKGTIVILASDHGEGLGEHGEPTHGPLCYGSTIDAVLAVRAPGFKGGSEDLGLRSVADVTPTLRILCGLDAAESDGKDLAGPPHDTLVAESLFTWAIHGWGQVFAATDGTHTLVEAGSSLELFDRREDPGESAPLPLSSAVYEKLDRAMERYRSARGGGAGGDDGELLGSVAPYGELRRRDTGYLSRHANAKLLNPRDHLLAWASLEGVPPLIKTCCARRDSLPLETALRTLDEIERQVSRSPRVDHYRAGVYAAMADINGVAAKYKDAAWAELAAIEKGYIQELTIVPAAGYCVAASDPEALRTLVKLLRRSGKKVNAESARAVAEAAKKLGVSDADAALSGN